jgi:predicted DNA-binding transcriptional regulator AlpA
VNKPRHSSFMRRQAVAFELGLSRHTLARIIKRDPTFPPFFAISPGVEVIERADFDTWLLRKRHAALLGAHVAPT